MSNIATVAAAAAAVVVVVGIASVVVVADVVVVLLESACCNRCSNAFLKPWQLLRQLLRLLLMLLLLRPVLIYCLETNYFQRSFFLPPCSPLLLIYFLYIQMLLKRFVIVA